VYWTELAQYMLIIYSIVEMMNLIEIGHSLCEY
jgi:hypothetical protein